MKHPMLVLHVVAPGEVGGLERVVQSLAQGQAQAGDDVHVAAVLDQANADHPLLGALAAAGVGTHSIVVPSRGYWRERAAMFELCRRLRPGIVHTHGYRPDIVDAGAARRLGIPTVTTVHGFTWGGWKNRLYERLQRRAYRRFDAVVVVSRPLVDRLAKDGVPPHRVHFVQNAWQETTPLLDRATARRALGLREDAFVIGWVGRLSAEKGPDVLLDALVNLTDLPVTVSVVGDGPERRSLALRAPRFGVEGLIRLHGAVPDAGRLFAAFDVFVLSSHTEGTPIVLFEAMGAGVPIVATRVGGVPDVVSPAEATLVAPNDPVALAAAIRAVYCDPTAGRQRAELARKRVRTDFTPSPWVDRYAAIYRLVNGAASDSPAVVAPRR
jgi:glycosyltransferase involved in cell wall biosynthesis